MLSMYNLEKLLEAIGRISGVIAAISILIWLYKDGTLFKSLFANITVTLLLFGFSFLFNRRCHQAWCNVLGVRFPYIVYLLPFVIVAVLFAYGLAKGAYYGCNPNNPICKQQIEQRKLSQ